MDNVGQKRLLMETNGILHDKNVFDTFKTVKTGPKRPLIDTMSFFHNTVIVCGIPFSSYSRSDNAITAQVTVIL